MQILDSFAINQFIVHMLIEFYITSIIFYKHYCLISSIE